MLPPSDISALAKKLDRITLHHQTTEDQGGWAPEDGDQALKEYVPFLLPLAKWALESRAALDKVEKQVQYDDRPMCDYWEIRRPVQDCLFKFPSLKP